MSTNHFTPSDFDDICPLLKGRSDLCTQGKTSEAERAVAAYGGHVAPEQRGNFPKGMAAYYYQPFPTHLPISINP